MRLSRSPSHSIPCTSPSSKVIVNKSTVPVGTGREVAERLLGRGVLVKDTHGSTIRIAPPLTIRATELDWAIEQLKVVLAA